MLVVIEILFLLLDCEMHDLAAELILNFSFPFSTLNYTILCKNHNDLTKAQ